jgi:hypothetical protein
VAYAIPAPVGCQFPRLSLPMYWSSSLTMRYVTSASRMQYFSQDACLAVSAGIFSFRKPTDGAIDPSGTGSHVHVSANTSVPRAERHVIDDTFRSRLHHSRRHPSCGKIESSSDMRTSWPRLCAHTTVLSPGRQKSVTHCQRSPGDLNVDAVAWSPVFSPYLNWIAAPIRHDWISVSPWWENFDSVSNTICLLGILH